MFSNILRKASKNLSDDFEDLESVEENLDNFQKKNNIKIRGLKEGVEGEDLPGYLMELFFSAWVGEDCEIVISISSAYRMRFLKPSHKHPRVVIVKFLQCLIKAKILENYWEQPNLTIDGSAINIYPDLSSITFLKRKSFKFLTENLQSRKVPYREGSTLN